MKKTTKIIFIVLSIMTLLLSIVALTMDVGVEAAKRDIMRLFFGTPQKIQIVKWQRLNL